MVTDTSSSVTPDVAEAIGASFTGLTVTNTSCVSVKSPSLTVIINISLPLKSGEALKLILFSLRSAEILIPPDILKDKSSPSISDPDKLIKQVLSSSK